MKKISLLFCFQILVSMVLNAQNKISNKTSDWSDASAWTPSGVPTSTNNVTISDGTTITMDVSGICNALTVGTGGSASMLKFSGNSALTLAVNGDLIVNTNGTLRSRTSSNATHSITLKGNIINNGVFDLARDANSLIDLVFTNNGNQSISGTGTTNNYNNIILNMGGSVTNILEITSTVFTIPTDFLILNNGTFKLSTPNAVSVTTFTSVSTIPVTAGLWLNSANAAMTTSAGINLSGKITVTAGKLNIGNAADEDLSVNGGSLIVSSGTLSIAGKYNASGSPSNFSLSGGTILVANVGSANTSIAPFQITAAGSQFNMTGGVLLIPNEGGNGAQDFGFVNTGSTAGAVTGGTLQIGNSSSSANQTININTTYSVANLVVNSSNVTAKINTNTFNVSNNITIITGTLNANNLGINLGGNWNNSGTFTAGTGTVSFVSVATQSIFKSGGETFNHLAFSGSGLKSFSSAVTSNGNFSITSGASVDVSISNFQLTVKGNFLNSGTFNGENGLVLLNGAAQQTIGGSSTTNFYNLTLSNTLGALLTNAENLLGTLTLSNGIFNTNSKAFTMVSTAMATARIAQITGTGDLSGNVTVQRFVPGGTTGWGLVGTPISSALTLNDWDDDIYITCPTCPDGSANGFSSIYSYNEPAPGLYDAAASYVALNTINDPIVSGKGYWIYLGNAQYTTSPITLDVTGAIRKFNYSIPLNYTNNGSPANDGWNLITNPYPSAISWASLKGVTSNIDNAVYSYNADLNSGTGGFASYVNGVSSPAVASGGIGDNIPMCQGFYVHSTGATALNATESNKVAGNPAFLKTNSANTNPLLRLNLNGNNSSGDETVLYFQQGATDGFDLNYDAYKMRGQDPLAPSIALVNGNDDFQVNGITPVSGSFSMALKVLTGYTGSYTLSLTDFSTFPTGACISLYDKVTTLSTDLKTSDYHFTLPDTTNASRFVLHITLNTLTVNHSLVSPTCQSPNAGKIIATGANSGPWNYYWKANGIILKTTLNKSTADTLDNLSGGNFELEMNTSGQCDNSVVSFSIDPKIIPLAQFSSIDTLYLEQSDSVKFTNTSVNSVSSTWLLGNSWFCSTTSPTQRYKAPGTYTVSLMCTSSTGCSSKVSKVLTVMADITGLNNQELFSSELVVKTLGNNEYTLQQEFPEPKNTNSKLYNLAGDLIKDYGTRDSKFFSLEVDLKNRPSGIYLIKITTDTNQRTLKLIAE